jgi:hypothetical protein
VVENEAPPGLVRILIEVIDAVGIEQRGTALDAVHFVTLVEQGFSQVGAVLAGHAGNQGNLLMGGHRGVIRQGIYDAWEG